LGQVLEVRSLNITIDVGLTGVIFLDVTLDLANDIYNPFRKPGDKPGATTLLRWSTTGPLGSAGGYVISSNKEVFL
jgi:hypothetical protein